jgi:hypothetical protein
MHARLQEVANHVRHGGLDGKAVLLVVSPVRGLCPVHMPVVGTTLLLLTELESQPGEITMGLGWAVVKQSI